jgi:hypothetical protein
MAGGMSHLDTFDPKPKKKDVMGKTECHPTKADGVMLGHYLKNTAEVMDKVCVINSMNSTQGAHEQGSYIMHTSYAMRGTIKHPSLGSWVLRLGGRIHPELPGFVAIDSSPDLTGGGFLGAKFAAAPIGSPEEGLKDSCRAAPVSTRGFRAPALAGGQAQPQFHEPFYPNADVKAYEELYREAVALMNSKDLKAFDLREESQATRDLYGTGRFAQGCMLARRLVEHGVRFVEVQLGGWDTHYDNFTGVEGRCHEFDQALPRSSPISRPAANSTTRSLSSPPSSAALRKSRPNTGRPRPPSLGLHLRACRWRREGRHQIRPHRCQWQQGQEGLVTVQDFNATIAHALGLNYHEVIISPTAALHHGRQGETRAAGFRVTSCRSGSWVKSSTRKQKLNHGLHGLTRIMKRL